MPLHSADGRVTNNGKHLEFTAYSFSPFAIVVELDEDAPQTSDNSTMRIYAGIMATSAVALAVILLKNRKQLSL